MKFISVLFLLISINGVLLGQTFRGQDASDLVSGAEEVVINASGSFSFISFYDYGAPSLSSEEIPRFLNPLLSLPTANSFVFKSNNSDKLGYSHLKYGQFYNGISVEGSALTVHMKDGKIKSISGGYCHDIDLNNLRPSISMARASDAAKEYMNAEIYAEEIQDEVVILPFRETYFLAIKFELKSLKPHDKRSIYVDANTGEVLWSLSHIHTNSAVGTADTRYSGEREIITEQNQAGSFSLQDFTRGDGIITRDLNGDFFSIYAENIYSQDDYWDDYFYGAAGGLDVHWGAEVTYDYFLDVFGRYSFDDQGAQIVSYVDYGIGQENAFWDGESFFYGAGAGNVNAVTSLDIVAHEYTHAITEHTANLYNSGEPGALNESFSDIFGVVIDFYVRGASDANYQIGEQVAGLTPRNMANPNSQNHPDTYQGTYWSYNGNSGIHTNAGVQNYWFYLLVEGGSGLNDNLDFYDVEGIGIESAAAIAYRTLTVYMHPNGDYFDSKWMSIQSAIDLYGHCSPEVISVTNAWEAVGVFYGFEEELNAGFSAASFSSCAVPAGIQFINSSDNATSFYWDFGDGQTSIEENPYHIYTASGSYTVTLDVTGMGECAGSDQYTSNNPISIEDEGGPVPANCFPIGLYSYGYSLTSLQIDDVELEEGSYRYNDLTCEPGLVLTEGLSYLAEVDAQYMAISFKGWIDFNNDGDLTDDEVIFQESNVTNEFDIPFVVPYGQTYNTPLRMRVILSFDDVDSSCPDVFFGQTNDYQVEIVPTTQLPQTDFDASTTIVHVGESVMFTDLSVNAPFGWEWLFPGGVADDINAQNPTVVYSQAGLYDVTLTTTNVNGSDELVKVNYIEVRNAIVMCEDQGSTSMYGVMYDSGGIDGNHGINEDCSVLINPPCADYITLTFEEFELEYCCDYLTVYDGNDNTGIELLHINGDNIPSPVTSYSGQMYVEFSSGWGGNYPGWVATWEAVELEDESEINFETSLDIALINQDIQFSDLSDDNVTEWLWDFGDGNFSNLQNPVHSYLESGVYTVTLQAGHCFDSGVFESTILIQNPGAISFSPNDSLFVNLNCGESSTAQFTIYNTGETDLTFSVGESELSANHDFNLLFYGDSALDAYSAYADILSEIPGQNLHFYNSSQDFEYFNYILTEIDVLVLPGFGFISSIPNEVSPIITHYINNGGHVLMLREDVPSQLNLFDDFVSAWQADSAIIENSDHQVLGGLTSLNHQKIGSVIGLDISNVDVLTSTYYSNGPTPNMVYSNPSVFTKVIGQGEIVYLPFELYYYSSTGYYYDSDQSQIIRNSILYLSEKMNTPFLTSSLLTSNQIVLPGDSLVVSLELTAEDLLPGIYYANFPILSNDVINDTLNYTVQLNIAGSPELEISATELEFNPGYVGAEHIDTLFIQNPSCEVLTIETTLSHPEFSVSESTLIIDAYQSDTLFVSYSPIDIDSDSAVLEMNSNAGLNFVNLIGSAILPPELSTSIVDTLYVPVNCTESGSAEFMVYNTGFSNLEVSVNTQTIEGPLKVLILTNDTTEVRYHRTIAPFLSSPRLLEIIEVSSANQDELESTIIDADICVIPSHVPIYDYINLAVLDFVFNGGQLLVNYKQSHTLSVFALNNNYVNYDEFLYYQVAEDDSPIVSGLPDFFMSDTHTASIASTSVGNHEPIVTRGGNAVVTSRNYGINNGHIYYFGYDHQYQSQWDSLIYQNIVDIMFEDAMPELIIMESSDVIETIAPSDSLLLSFNFDASQTFAGHHYGIITVESNDPDTPSIQYIYDLHILGHTELGVSVTEIDFGSLIVGNESSQNIVVSNLGCDTLYLDVQLDGVNFEITQNVFEVSPYSQETLEITFIPDAEFLYENVLSISSQENDEIVTLSGMGLNPPELSFSFTDTVSFILGCDAADTVSYTIYNTGLNQLAVFPHTSYISNFVDSSNWITYEFIEPGDSLVVVLNLQSGQNTEGAYYYNFPVTTNDPNWAGSVVFNFNVVNYEPEIALNLFPIDFGQVLLGENETVQITMLNLSCGPFTEYYSVSVDEFSLNTSTVYFPAFESRVIYLHFEPSTIAYFTDTLVIEGVGGNFSIPISGEGVLDLSSSILDNKAQSFKIYPNPSNGTFIIDNAENTGIIDLQIMNVLGQSIDFDQFNNGKNRIEIKIQNPVTGVYIVKGLTEAGVLLESRIVLY